MRPSLVALLVLGAGGAGAAYYFLVVKPRHQALAGGTSSAPAAVSTKTPARSSGLLGDHVDRKNALAPQVVSRITGGLIPVSLASKVTSIAGKLDVSSYAERYVSTKVPIVGKIAEAPITGAKKLISGIASLF